MKKNNTLGWRIVSNIISSSDYTVLIDMNSYKMLNVEFGKEKIKYIANPIDVKKIINSTKTSSKNIIFIGAVVKSKGVEELLEAWESLKEIHVDWKLDIVGSYSTDYLRELNNRFSSENVTFYGELSHADTIELLNQSEIFAFPSHTEGFPNVVLEAMALSKSIVASKVGAIPDMLEDNCGIIIEPKNSEQLIDAINKLILEEELRQRMGDNAYKKVVSQYDISKIFEKYRQLWMGQSR